MPKATFRQTAFMYCIGTACFAVFLLPGAVSRYAGKVAVVIPLLSIVFTAGIAYVLFRAVAQFGSLRRLVCARLGEGAARAGAVLLWLWLSAIAVFYLCAFYERLSSTAFGYLPRFVCISAAALCAALFTLAPPRAAGRSAAIIFILMLICLALLLLFCAEGVSLKRLLPVKAESFTGVLCAFLFPVGSTGLLCFLLYDFEGKNGSLRAYEACAVGSNVFMSAVLLMVQSVFGTALSEKLSYPFFALIRSTDSLVKLEHFESLISGVWIVMSLGFFVLLVRVLTAAFCGSLPQRGFVKRAKPLLSLLPIAAVLLFALFLPVNRYGSEWVLGTLMPAGNLLLGVVPVCILTLTNRR